MRKLWDFHGGIHPPENKHQSTQSSIRSIALPDTLVLPLNQHIGAAADPCVRVGDTVLKGQMIATAVGRISVAVHAPTSGTIAAIEEHPVPHPSGMSDNCIVLRSDGEDRWMELTFCADYKQLSAAEILSRVRQAGIAGMGGAGFPTEVKLHPPSNDKVNSLILNGAECEPYITADDLLMQERAKQIVKGMEIMAYVLEPEETLIGIEDNKPKAIAAMREAAANTRIEVIVVPTKYPSGGEKQLIRILTGREVPQGSIPADIGIMCQNVATAAAVYRAIRFGEPLISRITTVVGESVPRPGNYEVLLGTAMSFLLQQAGLPLAQDATAAAPVDITSHPRPNQGHCPAVTRLIMGGPMMGFTLPNASLPVIKTTNCLLAATPDEFPGPATEQACIRCGMCADVCPAELLPQQLFWYAKAEEFDKTEMYNLFDCIECGACSYVCPSHIPLVQYYRFAKDQIRAARIEQRKSDLSRARFEYRQQRLDREQQEKAAKRKARAESAAKAQAAKAASDQPEQAETTTMATTAKAGAGGAESKQYIIEAAVERAQQKHLQVEAESSKPPALEARDPEGPQNHEESRNLDELLDRVTKTKAKLEKLQDSLATSLATNGDQSNSPATEKLSNAVEKNKIRLAAAEQALAAAQATAPSTQQSKPA